MHRVCYKAGSQASKKRHVNTFVQKNDFVQNLTVVPKCYNKQKKVNFLFVRKNYSIFIVCYNILTSISLEYEFIIILWSGNGMSSHAKLNFTPLVLLENLSGKTRKLR